MGRQAAQTSSDVPGVLAGKQHGVVTRRQLLALGFSDNAINHRIATSRLHPVRRGVYAVGRPELSGDGHLLAAVLSCGPDAVASHESAAALYSIRRYPRGPVEISVPASRCPRRPGIRVHRRANLGPEQVTRWRGIPVTSPVVTLVDLAVRLRGEPLEAAVNEADKLGLCDPETLRAALEAMEGQPGTPALGRMLDCRTFALTDSPLERHFLSVIRSGGLPMPQTQCRLNGFKVDFFWPDLGLVVETDGLRYHRTPSQQAHDRLRDQTHTTAGLTALRFTHAQVTAEPHRVKATLTAVMRRLEARHRSG
jgi:very-short-patch-repair endonuclease